ncbi:MAG: rod shape-determining protein MreD [Flavobacteriales bacterium]
MDRIVLQNIVRFLLLVIVQVLILNNIQFLGIINPYLYIYLLLVLPVDFSPNGGLFVGFLLGLTLDLFCQTLGMHTIATTFAAYCRPYIMRYMAPRDGYEFSRVPGIRQMGWLWFITYSAVVIFLHHFVLFFVEMFRMSGFWLTLGKSLGSTFMTLTLVLIVQMLFVSSTRAKAGYE